MVRFKRMTVLGFKYSRGAGPVQAPSATLEIYKLAPLSQPLYYTCPAS